ncbi:hypothetical protein JNUCC0626_27350 [Lentzea sp. JNUCC 0626]|uniref:hypothetical protein n=1 Tax=Lentzea sp. JNUCC 0626 TaxID=3367513 RepID=UPI00374838B3
MIIKPTDNGREIPWIDDWLRPVVRLHQSPGTPARADSHSGGPMLWPSDEPWPHCDGSSHGTGYDLTAEQVELVRGRSTPFTGAMQLYRRDFPELPFPDGTDLLQVFLCLLEHEEIYGPDVHLVWRAAGEVTDPLAEPPLPEVVDPVYAIWPCVFTPCRSHEYPMHYEIPHELLYELEFAQAPDFRGGPVECWPGHGDSTKIGGWTRWYRGMPGGETCPDCGALRVQMLALASSENECPACDRPEGKAGWRLDGRDDTVNVFACPKDPRHALWVDIQ